MEEKIVNVAFIPVRGGSKSIPLKNIKYIAGRPLVYWCVKSASECSYIDRIYVATDSEQIADVVRGFFLDKVEVIGRSEESAGDSASTEFAMLEFAEKYDFDNIALIQATSPLIKSTDLDKGFELMKDESCDSVLSVVPQKRFYWQQDCNNYISPVNYDVFNRPRRQEFEGYLTENGAFYITSKELLLKSKNRVSGNIRAVEMCEESAFEIDEPLDWIIIEQLLKHVKKDDFLSDKLKKIKMFLTDCDGCLTDGGMYYTDNGDEIKKFNTLDGKGFELLQSKGIICGIITGENIELVERRAKKLSLPILKMGIKDKVNQMKLLCDEYGIIPENIAYIGDDIADIEIIKAVGFGCCVNNAMKEVKDAADYITTRNGGEGAVREVAELILRVLE